MKLFSIISFLCIFLFPGYSKADSTCVSICYSGEVWFPEYFTVGKEVNRFDSAGRLIQNENYSFEYVSWNQPDTGFRLVSRTDYGYNADGLIDSMLFTQVNFNGTYYSRTNYYYDSQGNLIEKNLMGGASFPLGPGQRTTYQYDSNNNKTQEKYEQYYGNQIYWTMNLYNWIYDAQDSVIEYHKINYNSNLPHDSIYEAYTFSLTGKILSKEEWYYFATTDSNYYVYQYDSNDSLVKYTEYYNTSGNSWIPNRMYVYSYTPTSINQIVSNCPDTACSDTMFSVITIYDTSGRIISDTRSDYDGGGWWSTISYTTNTYDTLGNIIDNYSHWGGGGGPSHTVHTTYDYNSVYDLIHSHTDSYSANQNYSDCYYYNLDSDSILVLIDFNDTVCHGSFIPLVITVEGGVPPYLFDWSPGSFLSDSTILSPLLAHVDSTITYQLSVTDSNGKSASDSLALFVFPDLYFPVNITTYGLPCENNAFHLTYDTLPDYYSNYVYWNTPTSSYYLYGDTILASQSGLYTLYMRDTNNCLYTNSTTLNLLSQPLISLGTDTTICLNDTIILIGGNFVQYQWSTGDVSASVEIYSSVQDNDTISLMVTDNNGCINSDTVVVMYEICSGISVIDRSEIKVTVFPEMIRIELPSGMSMNFLLTDMSGRIVNETTIHQKQNIDISQLLQGIYVYTIDKKYSGKFRR